MIGAQMEAFLQEWGGPLGALAAGVLLGWLLLFLARRQDRKGWLYARAPALPIRSLAAHDDAWIRGTVKSEDPLRCPWFNLSCAHYNYRIEREYTETYEDSKGKTRKRTFWSIERSESRTIPFELDDGERISVRATDAEFHGLESTGDDYEYHDLRHTAELLQIGSTASVLGVRRDDGSFGKMQEVPLLVTPQTREEFIGNSERSERWLRRLGFFLQFAGGVAAVLVLRSDAGLDAQGIALALSAGCVAFLPGWLLSTYNRFVRLRQQLEASWGQVDVDLGVRCGLVPPLVAVIEGYREHESTLLENLARLRAAGSAEERIREEGRAVSTSKQVLALVEKYPELKADALFSDLHERLWAVEEKLAASRTLYNGYAVEWNDLVQSFPSVLAARLFRHEAKPFFRLGSEEWTAPSVEGTPESGVGA